MQARGKLFHHQLPHSPRGSKERTRAAARMKLSRKHLSGTLGSKMSGHLGAIGSGGKGSMSRGFAAHLMRSVRKAQGK